MNMDPGPPTPTGPVPRAPLPGTRLLDAAALGAVVVSVSVVVARQVPSVFDFFDMSSFLDAGYRVACGQRPYVDFIFTAGPVHLWSMAVFFSILGFTKTAVVAHVTVVNGIVMSATYGLARRSLGLVEATAVATLSGIAFYGVVAHPWYDQTASLFVVVGVLLVDRPGSMASGRRALVTGLACGGLSGLALLSKANVGVGAIGLFALAFVGSPRRLEALWGLLLGTVTGTIVPLIACGSGLEFVHQSLVAYSPGSRFADMERLLLTIQQCPASYLSLVFLVVIVVRGAAGLDEQPVRSLLTAGVLFASLFSAWTGSMIKGANFPLLGVEVALILALARTDRAFAPDRTAGLTRRAPGLLLWLLAPVLIVHATTVMTRHTVWSWHGSTLQADYQLRAEPFRGWWCNGAIGEGVDLAVAWIGEHVPREDSIFVFPDATVIYGLAGRQSFRGAPFLFHVEHMPPPGRLYDRFRLAFVRRPPRWIVLHLQSEKSFFDTALLLDWLKLDRFIAGRYRQVWRQGQFAIFKRSD
ncbi:MAG: hypothetical protein HY815_15300 [Candidatus Riflebacteria bacterium]|nr:hypothetical protein [Candidatus Riflebacteria bacterium]